MKETLLLAYHFNVQTLVTVLKQLRLTDPNLEGYLPRAIEDLGHYRGIAAGLANYRTFRQRPATSHLFLWSLPTGSLQVETQMPSDTIRTLEATTYLRPNLVDNTLDDIGLKDKCPLDNDKHYIAP